METSFENYYSLSLNETHLPSRNLISLFFLISYTELLLWSLHTPYLTSGKAHGFKWLPVLPVKWSTFVLGWGRLALFILKVSICHDVGSKTTTVSLQMWKPKVTLFLTLGPRLKITKLQSLPASYNQYSLKGQSLLGTCHWSVSFPDFNFKLQSDLLTCVFDCYNWLICKIWHLIFANFL